MNGPLMESSTEGELGRTTGPLLLSVTPRLCLVAMTTYNNWLTTDTVVASTPKNDTLWKLSKEVAENHHFLSTRRDKLVFFVHLCALGGSAGIST